MERNLVWAQQRTGADHRGNQGGRELLLRIIYYHRARDDSMLKLVVMWRASPPFLGGGGGGGDDNMWLDGNPSGIEPAEGPGRVATPFEEQRPRRDASRPGAVAARTMSSGFRLIMSIGGGRLVEFGERGRLQVHTWFPS
jgi:hypothetical protein